MTSNGPCTVTYLRLLLQQQSVQLINEMRQRNAVSITAIPFYICLNMAKKCSEVDISKQWVT